MEIPIKASGIVVVFILCAALSQATTSPTGHGLRLGVL